MPAPKIDFCIYAMLSTSHITKDDSVLLTKLSSDDSESIEKGILLTCYAHPAGYFMPLDYAVVDYSQLLLLMAAGYSLAFVQLISRLSDQGVELLQMDSDGEIVDEFPTFDW
mgnify:CR=1 FL=1